MKPLNAIIGPVPFSLALAVFTGAAGAAEVVNLGRSPEVLARVAVSGAASNRTAFHEALGLSNVEKLEIIKQYDKARGRDVARYRQTFRGVPVWRRQIVVERDKSGRVSKLKGQLIAGLARDIHRIKPGIGADEIVASMKARVTEGFGSIVPVFTSAKGELVIFVSDNGAATLSYAVSFLADSEEGGYPTRPTFVVDAFTGKVLFEYDALTHQQDDCSDGCLLLDEGNISASIRTWKQFSVTIPQDAIDGSTMVVRSSGGSGDGDLYVRQGSQPTSSAYACRPYLSGNDESCSVNINRGETWYFGLYAYSSFSGVSLRADVQAPLQQIGSGPGGNERVGLYYYGREYNTLEVSSDTSQCTMINGNVKTVDLDKGTEGSTAFSYDKINADCYNASDSINGAYSPLNDAHYFGGIVYSMYNAYLGEPPLTFQLTMRVHYSTNYENAFWDGSSMTFGDGKSYFYPLVSIDVSSHEVSHGFTEQNSNLVYAGQSGGMNEAFSDIAGEAAEFFMRGSADFLVGADIVKNGGSLRNMMNPPADGNSIDNAGDFTNNLNVHYSSGVYNKAFYLLATSDGWDVEDAFLVFANANRYCWTSDSDFVDGAQCVVDEAAKLGSPVLDVVTAFAGVGISGLDVGVVPGTPVLSISEKTSVQITLAWDDIAGETGYSLRRSESASAVLDAVSEIALVSADVTTYTDTNLTPDTMYYYQLVAVNNTAESASEIVSTRTLRPPGC